MPRSALRHGTSWVAVLSAATIQRLASDTAQSLVSATAFSVASVGVCTAHAADARWMRGHRRLCAAATATALSMRPVNPACLRHLLICGIWVL